MAFDTFPRTIFFGALAALGYFPWMLLSAGPLGSRFAFTLYLIATLAAYVFAVSRRPSQGILFGGVALAMGIGAALFAGTPGQLAFLCALIVAVLRSGFLRRRSAARAIAVEGGVLALSLGAASFFFSASMLDVAFAIWVFFVVQSGVYLISDANPAPSRPTGDPFEAATRRLETLLDEV